MSSEKRQLTKLGDALMAKMKRRLAARAKRTEKSVYGAGRLALKILKKRYKIPAPSYYAVRVTRMLRGKKYVSLSGSDFEDPPNLYGRPSEAFAAMEVTRDTHKITELLGTSPPNIYEIVKVTLRVGREPVDFLSTLRGVECHVATLKTTKRCTHTPHKIR